MYIYIHAHTCTHWQNTQSKAKFWIKTRRSHKKILHYISVIVVESTVCGAISLECAYTYRSNGYFQVYACVTDNISGRFYSKWRTERAEAMFYLWVVVFTHLLQMSACSSLLRMSAFEGIKKSTHIFVTMNHFEIRSFDFTLHFWLFNQTF